MSSLTLPALPAKALRHHTVTFMPDDLYERADVLAWLYRVAWVISERYAGRKTRPLFEVRFGLAEAECRSWGASARRLPRYLDPEWLSQASARRPDACFLVLSLEELAFERQRILADRPNVHVIAFPGEPRAA